MKVKFSPRLQKEIRIIYKTNRKLADRIEKQLDLFGENPKHPSLRLHKLSGNLKNLWSVSISREIRMVYLLLENGDTLFIKLGSHDEVYGKKG